VCVCKKEQQSSRRKTKPNRKEFGAVSWVVGAWGPWSYGSGSGTLRVRSKNECQKIRPWFVAVSFWRDRSGLAGFECRASCEFSKTKAKRCACWYGCGCGSGCGCGRECGCGCGWGVGVQVEVGRGPGKDMRLRIEYWEVRTGNWELGLRVRRHEWNSLIASVCAVFGVWEAWCGGQGVSWIMVDGRWVVRGGVVFVACLVGHLRCILFGRLASYSDCFWLLPPTRQSLFCVPHLRGGAPFAVAAPFAFAWSFSCLFAPCRASSFLCSFLARWPSGAGRSSFSRLFHLISPRWLRFSLLHLAILAILASLTISPLWGWGFVSRFRGRVHRLACSGGRFVCAPFNGAHKRQQFATHRWVHLHRAHLQVPRKWPAEGSSSVSRPKFLWTAGPYLDLTRMGVNTPPAFHGQSLHSFALQTGAAFAAFRSYAIALRLSLLFIDLIDFKYA